MTIASLPLSWEGGSGGSCAPPPVSSTKLFIRANQGHSIKGVVDEEKLLTKVRDASDVPVCVHGTNLKCWPR